VTVPAVPHAVLFDMDGTLIDSEHLWLAAEIQVMDALGGQWTSEDQSHCLGGPLERVADYMIWRSGTSASQAEVGRALLDTIEGLMRDEPLTWRPGAREILAETIDLGIPRALVTASWQVLVNALADRMREDMGGEPFTAVVAGDHTRHSKPHPEPYLMAASACDVAPSSSLALEDSPTGVRSARDAGCAVVAVPHMAPIMCDGVHVIDTLHGHSIEQLWIAACSVQSRFDATSESTERG
jgi:HAD superfamily hydrolase (TIGR01509 family)